MPDLEILCPVCERKNGKLVPDISGFALCVPCHQITNMVERGRVDEYLPRPGEDVPAWMRRLQDEHPEVVKSEAVS